MTDPSTPEWELAERVLACEESRHGAPVDMAFIGEEVLRHLHERLALWFGDDGVQALLGRAIDRAADRHPILADVRSAPLDGRHFDRLPHQQSPGEPGVPREALLELLGTLFALLSRLLGLDLVTRLVTQIWPEAALRIQDTTAMRIESRE